MKAVSKIDQALKIVLYLIFSVALVSGINLFVNGVAGVPGFQGAVDPAIDNELRFLSAYWISFGFFCLSVARSIESSRRFIPFIALAFFFSGIGRLISFLNADQTIYLFVAVMFAELILPVIILVMHYQQRKEMLLKFA